MTQRTYDLVLFGATGFTGRLVAKYLAKIADGRHPELRWAIVGRNEAKLKEVAAEVEAAGYKKPPILLASAKQEEVDRVISQARVCCSTAGPYANHGTPVVDACVRLGCHYTDINGEVGWHREMIDRYDGLAREKGVVLVPSAGFDSLPSDLGAQWMAERIQSTFGTPARRVKSYVTLDGSFSGGTVASGILGEETHGARLANPFLLGGGPAGAARAEDADMTTALYDEAFGAWTAPFGMSTINTRIVRRSAALLEERGSSSFSPDFTYAECQLAPSEEAAAKMARANEVPAAVLKQMIEKGRLPKPGEGPSPEKRAKSWFKLLLLAEASGDPSKRLLGSISGGDPGYEETAKMVAETALALGTHRDALPARGGFQTTATACGSLLRERLHAEGIRFEEVDLSTLPAATPAPAPRARL